MIDTIPYITPVPIPLIEVTANRLAAGLEAGSSPWWIARLTAAMDAREARLRTLRAYFRGEQDTRVLHSEAARLAFGRAFSGLKSNLAEPIVEAPAQRLKIEGFRVPVDGETDAAAGASSDTEAWRIWQANGMDSRSVIAHTEAIAMGECPVIVARNPDDGTTPLITVEDPLQVVIERDPANPRRRLAALKRWTEPDLSTVLVLYLPDRIEWWRGTRGRFVGGYRGTSPDSFDLRGIRWKLDAERSGEPPVMGVVPVVTLVNKPRVDGTGRGEHEPVLSLLDALNKELLDLLTTSEFAAFPQRYAIGVSLDEEQGETDDDGNVTPAASPIVQAVNRWVSTDNPEAKFGTLEAAALEPYTKAIATIVEHIGTITFTPYHLLLNAPTSVPATGEALKTAERSLDTKTERKQIDFGEGWEEVMRLAFLTAGDTSRASTRSEVRWRAPSTANEAQHVDALSKLKAMGVDMETLLELVPFSPEQIARIKARQAAAPQPEMTPDQANTAGVLVRSGWTPEGALDAAGAADIPHTGLLPVTVQAPDA